MKDMDLVFTAEWKKIEADGITKDYINIEYKDASNLFVPASQLELIQKTPV